MVPQDITFDHKPDTPKEKECILACGSCVFAVEYDDCIMDHLACSSDIWVIEGIVEGIVKGIVKGVVLGVTIGSRDGWQSTYLQVVSGLWPSGQMQLLHPALLLDRMPLPMTMMQVVVQT